jgi:hypothetical protein
MSLLSCDNGLRACQPELFLRTPLILLFAFGVALLPALASARTKLQGVVDGSVAVTDNASSSPDEPPPGVPPKEADVYGIITPGLVLASVQPWVLHRLTYSYSTSLYVLHPEANAYSNRLEYLGRYDTSPRSDLTLGAFVMQAHHHTQSNLVAASATAINAAFPGTGAFLATGIEESFGYSLSPEWDVRQSSGLALQTPIRSGTGAPTSYELTNAASIERTFLADAVGMEGSTRYSLITNARNLDGTPADDQAHLINQLVGLWRHDYGRYVTSRIDAGVVQLVQITRDNTFWHPAGGAALAYVTEDGEAELAYSHGVRASLFLGQTFLVDEVRLRGAIPLDDDSDVVLSASSGYQSSRIFDENGEPAAEVDLVIVDAAIAWLVTDHVALSARYQHIQQQSDADVVTLPLSFVRNNAMVGARFEYPPDREMPRAYRAPRRVDRADEVQEAFDLPTSAPGSQGTGR